MGNIIDLTGQRFRNLTVLRFAGLNKHRKSLWDCRCDCGNPHTTIGAHLVSGHTTSCGCTGFTSKLSHGHIAGHVKSPTYISWQAMIRRCTSPSVPQWKDYGGRGITVCARWQSFENFLADMGERPSKAHSIDRFPDNDGNYEPGNCRWATRGQQAEGRSTSKLSYTAACLIRYMVKRGESHRDIGHAFGVSHAAVQWLLKSDCWRTPPNPPA